MRLRSFCSRIRDLLSVQRNDQNLLLAQYSAVSKQVPLLYLVLLANTWVLAHTFSNLAPVELAFYVPAGLTAICLYRLVKWKGSLKRVPTAAVAFKQLSRTNRLSLLLALGFSSWAVALYPYGDVAAQAHVAFYMAITSVACIFCLMYLRSAALTVAIVVNAVFIVFFGLSAQPTFVAIALNMFIVTLAMIIVLTVNHRQLVQLVTARDNAQALIGENFKLANLDPLTGLPNRRQFFAHLDREFEHAKREGHRLAVGVMDLDGFKPVNDLYGHAVGDALLIEVGRRLREACGLKLHLARIGGDEFALIMSNLTRPEDALAIAEQFVAAIADPFPIDGFEISSAISIGIVLAPRDGSTSHDLLKHADIALYRSKLGGRDRVTLWTPEAMPLPV
mgnify:CR=1 FL=1